MSAVQTNYDEKPWIKMPISELTNFKAGRICFYPAYWSITDDDCVLFYKSYGSPQCNANQKVIEYLSPNLKIVFIEQAYLPHRCSDYSN